MSARKWLGVRFSEADVFSGNDGRKVLLETALLQDVTDLLPPGAGSDRKREPAGRALDGRRGAREQDVLFRDRLEVEDAFPADELREFFVFQSPRPFVKQQFETVPVVQGKVLI